MPGFPRAGVDLSPLDDVVDTLRAAGVRSVSRDSSKVNAPGVWVQLTGVTIDTLDGYALQCRLVLIAPAADPVRSTTALVDLLNIAAGAVPPHSAVQLASVYLPETPAPHPGMTYTRTLRP